MPDQARQKVNFGEREAPLGDDGLLVTYDSRHPELDYVVNQGACDYHIQDLAFPDGN